MALTPEQWKEQIRETARDNGFTNQVDYLIKLAGVEGPNHAQKEHYNDTNKTAYGLFGITKAAWVDAWKHIKDTKPDVYDKYKDAIAAYDTEAEFASKGKKIPVEIQTVAAKAYQDVLDAAFEKKFQTKPNNLQRRIMWHFGPTDGINILQANPNSMISAVSSLASGHGYKGKISALYDILADKFEVAASQAQAGLDAFIQDPIGKTTDTAQETTGWIFDKLKSWAGSDLVTKDEHSLKRWGIVGALAVAAVGLGGYLWNAGILGMVAAVAVVGAIGFVGSALALPDLWTKGKGSGPKAHLKTLTVGKDKAQEKVKEAGKPIDLAKLQELDDQPVWLTEAGKAKGCYVVDSVADGETDLSANITFTPHTGGDAQCQASAGATLTLN